jgi:simple sugar transport system permease protein
VPDGTDPLGRVFYAVGGNEAAAYLAGASVKLYRVAAYVISGTLSALGGVFVAARVGRGDVFAGSSLLLDSVAAALIGFAVLDQRRPNVLGTVTGAVFVGLVLNGLTMLNVPYYTQDSVKGIVLVGALALISIPSCLGLEVAIKPSPHGSRSINRNSQSFFFSIIAKNNFLR